MDQKAGLLDKFYHIMAERQAFEDQEQSKKNPKTPDPKNKGMRLGGSRRR